jgi:2,4-dienoyl-CoA reductase-like NADH-dependent reductase (Old Yellow Enzyme family)
MERGGKMSVDLFKPYRIGTLELKNRFVRSLVGDTWADDSRDVTSDSLACYCGLTQGRVGLIEAGNATISLHAHILP